MIRFEIKKIFSKTANKIGLIVLLAAIAVTCYFAISSMLWDTRIMVIPLVSWRLAI